LLAILAEANFALHARLRSGGGSILGKNLLRLTIYYRDVSAMAEKGYFCIILTSDELTDQKRLSSSDGVDRKSAKPGIAQQ
jgi:hypothetical protein